MEHITIPQFLLKPGEKPREQHPVSEERERELDKMQEEYLKTTSKEEFLKTLEESHKKKITW